MTTIFEEEIRSQGTVLAERASRGTEQARHAAARWRESGGVTHALVAARGSSDHAGVFFQYLAGRELGLLVSLATPSLYRAPNVVRLTGAGVLAISQSGQSPDIVEVLAQGRAQGRPCLAVTNDPASPLAREADAVLELFAGHERALASSKTFSASWHALAQLVQAMKDAPLAGLDALPALAGDVAAWALGHEVAAPLLEARQGLTMVGRGVGYAAASEIALKIREVAGVRAESYAAPDLLHGPIGADGRGAAMWLLVTEEISDDDASHLLAKATDSGMATVALRSESRAPLAADCEVVVPVSAENWAFALAAVIVGQVAALRLGEHLGRPVDMPPGLSKVTLTS